MRLCELINNHFLHQFINNSTRMNNTLGLFFANKSTTYCPQFEAESKGFLNLYLSISFLIIEMRIDRPSKFFPVWWSYTGSMLTIECPCDQSV